MNKSGKSALMTKAQVQEKARKCISEGSVRFAKANYFNLLRRRDLRQGDLNNVIYSKSAKVANEWNEEFQEYRYIFKTNRIEVLISFDPPDTLAFITFYRLKKGRRDGR